MERDKYYEVNCDPESIHKDTRTGSSVRRSEFTNDDALGLLSQLARKTRSQGGISSAAIDINGGWVAAAVQVLPIQ